LLSEKSQRVAYEQGGGYELASLTHAMVGVALILEPEMQSDNLIDYLEKQQFWAQIREHWRQQHAQN